jgi:hypothetical protein
MDAVISHERRVLRDARSAHPMGGETQMHSRESATPSAGRDAIRRGHHPSIGIIRRGCNRSDRPARDLRERASIG